MYIMYTEDIDKAPIPAVNIWIIGRQNWYAEYQ